MLFSQKFFKSLLPTRYYLGLLQEPASESFFYFFRLALLIGAFHWLLIIVPLRTNISVFFDHLSKEVPPFVIKNGQAVVNFSQPKVIVLPFNSQFVIDTTGKIKLPPLNTWVSFLVTRDQVMVQARGWLHRFALPDDEFQVDRSFWQRLKGFWSVRLTFFSLLFLLLKTMMTKFLHYVLVSGYAMVLDAIWGLKLEYRQLLNVCIYALTPISLLGLALGMSVYWLPTSSPYLRLTIYYGVYLTFITIVLWQVRLYQKTYELSVETEGIPR